MAKFNGTNGNDILTGTSNDDEINGKSGDDLLSGLAGADKIKGGSGEDTVEGGLGNDLLVGGDQADTVLGGAGQDVIYGDGGGPQNGFDAWDTGFGDLKGLYGDDDLEGGAGDDYVFGDGGNDLARYGVSENIGALDRYSGGPGVDTLLLRMTRAEWFLPAVQSDIASYLSFLAAQTDPVSGEADAQQFGFSAFGLSAREFENLRVVVDGVELSPEDDPVTALDDTVSLGENDGETLFGSVLGNDDVPDLAYNVQLISGPALGTLTFLPGTPGAADGRFLFDPTSAFDSLTVGESAEVRFTYEVTDANGDTDQAEVSITVTGENDAPIVQQAGLIVNEADGVFEIDLRTYVSDPDTGDLLSLSDIRISRGSAPILFTVSPEGVIRIDPSDMGVPLDSGDVLATRFSYTVTDDSGAANDSAQGMVDLTINGIDGEVPPPPPPVVVNAPPVASDFAIAGDEGSEAIIFDISDLATDPDTGDLLSVTEITGMIRGVSGQNVAFSQVGSTISIDPSQFFYHGGVGEAGLSDPTNLFLEEGEVAVLALDFTVQDNSGDAGNDSDMGVITLTLTGDTPTNTAPVALNIPGVAGYPSGFDGSGVIPGDVEVDDPASLTFVVDFDDLISDAEGDPLSVTPGDLVIGTDESSGLPITVPYVYDAITKVLTVTLADVPLLDGESVLATLEYEVSDGLASTLGQITVNFTDPAAPVVAQRVLDFEPFAIDPGDQIVLPTLDEPLSGSDTIANYEGFIFQGSATVFETDELGGAGRGGAETAGLSNGQTTPAGDNVLVGTFGTTQVPLLDEFGVPVLDRSGDPVLETVAEDAFAILAPDSRYGIGDPGSLLANDAASGLVFPDPGSAGAFDLDGLSLNVAAGTDVAVTVTTYRLGVVEEVNTDPVGTSDYYSRLVVADTFEFSASAATSATLLDFNDAGFVDDLGKTDATGFDDIFAVSFVSDGGVAMVFDDILMTL